MKNAQILIRITYQTKFTNRSLIVVGNLRHTHTVIAKKSYAIVLFRGRATVVHVVTYTVCTTAQCTYHQRFGCFSLHNRATAIHHLNTYTHLRTERRILVGIIAHRRIIWYPLNVFKQTERRHRGLCPKRIGVSSSYR